MYAARRSVQAVIVVFAASSFSSPVFSQSAQFFSVEARSLGLLSPPSSANPCSVNGSVNGNRSVAALPGDPYGNGSASSCGHSLSKASAPLPVVPCNLSTRAITPCSASADLVRDDLNTMGKQGQLILHARDKVLAILQTENACTDWYRAKNPDPAAVFRTLTFSVDRSGDGFVRETPATPGIEMIHNPYVASVVQDGGPSSTVTLNANGAFFFPAANVVEDRFQGGPVDFRGARAIQVGPYAGGSFRAQVLVLLHEFGHVIDLLPEDRDDRDGKSRQNTLDVLRACRAEVESKKRPTPFWRHVETRGSHPGLSPMVGGSGLPTQMTPDWASMK